MQRLELRVRVSVHTPPSDRRPEQVPLALSKPPQYKGLHQDSPPRGRTSTVHTTTNVMAPRTLGYTLRWHNERVLNLFKVSPEMFPWAFKNGNPQKRIAALELLGILVLTHCILQKQGTTAAAVRIPVGSVNQGNVFALLNFASKKPHTAAILMELVLRLHVDGCSLAPCHVPR